MFSYSNDDVVATGTITTRGRNKGTKSEEDPDCQAPQPPRQQTEADDTTLTDTTRTDTNRRDEETR